MNENFLNQMSFAVSFSLCLWTVSSEIDNSDERTKNSWVEQRQKISAAIPENRKSKFGIALPIRLARPPDRSVAEQE